MPHIDVERLHAIAESDDLSFTKEEYDHLSVCPDCLPSWAHAVAEAKEKPLPRRGQSVRP
jgi:hypothetical protein